ncbi:Trp biosynthesis-associated membrane protein [Quadrisphaera sp. KR29]|uniref:Trp biosynthesis-associated membrane protein n=1 Tax=Quadrisphaera sp. KR29 TaxID=3461391 RepID=UPI0040447DC7
MPEPDLPGHGPGDRPGDRPGDPPRGRSRGRRRGRAPVVLLGLVAGALLLVASTQPWVLAALPVGPGGSAAELAVSGRDSAAAVPAVGVVAVAGALALSTLRGAGRVAAGALLVLAGLAAAAAAVVLVSDPLGAAVPAARAATGVGEVDGARTTAWPFLALVPALGVLASGALALVRGRSWGSSERFEAPTSAAGPGGPARASGPVAPSRAGLWDGLSRGEDPTAGPGDPDGDSEAQQGGGPGDRPGDRPGDLAGGGRGDAHRPDRAE